MTSYTRVFLERKKRQFFGTRRRTLNTLSYAAFGFLGLVLVGILGIGILFAWYAKDLPRPDKVRRNEGLTTVVLDRNGNNLYDIYEDENRIPAKLEEIPQYLRDATIAIEDKSFYTHQGLSTLGIVRSLFRNIATGGIAGGGSTLTQQLVKNVLLTSEQTLPRKIKEAILAIQIERKYTKDEILLMYLNETPYGGTAVGVEAAAKYYFDKPVSDLGLIESAILAGLPQSPSRYSPFIGEDGAFKWRTEQVLRRMKEDGYISQSQEEMAKSQLDSVVFARGSSDLIAPHFVEYVRQQLRELIGDKPVDAGGLKVTTTLDLDLQKEAQEIVLEEVDKAKSMRVSNGSAVILDPVTGEILAMVGSKDYSASESGGFKFNVAVQGLRQPGSSMKPIAYAAALKKGYTAATMLMDVDTKYPSGEEGKPEYNPKNYDLKYRGPMQLRYALGNSINTIAVKVSALVGVKDILRLAYDMGLSTLEPTDENLRRFGLSLSLGGGEVTLLELTHAYGVLANKGERQELVSILKVEDSDGKTIYSAKQGKPERVLSEDIAFIMSDILSDNGARSAVFGERSYLVIPGKTVAVKTGTTDDKRDNWTVGYTTNRVVGVWVGNNDNSPMHPSLASGVTGAAPIWNRLMRLATKDSKDVPFAKPDSVIEMTVDSFAGGTPVDDSQTRKEYFVRGTEPTSPASVYQMLKVSRKDGSKLANDVEVAKGEYDMRSFIVIREDDPVSTDGKNRWQEPIDAWVAAQSDAKYRVPTEVYRDGAKVSVTIREPNDRDRIDRNTIRVRAVSASITRITKMELSVDGSKRHETNSDSLDIEIDIANGPHTISVRAYDDQGNSESTSVRIGINSSYESPTPTPSPSPVPTSAPPTATPPPPSPTP